jgi:protein ImuA
MSACVNKAEALAGLRAEVRKIEGIGNAGAADFLPFGIEAVDGRIAGGGLAAIALHDVAAATAELADDAAATLFLAAIAARKAKSAGGRDGTDVLWVLPRRDLFAPGLAAVGLTPERLLYAECRNDEEVLAVMEEGLRHGGLAAVVGEVGRCGMASARRLQLAAEEGGTMALMLRRWRKADREPLAELSPAVTRWRIGCAPSAPLPVAGVGRPCWHAQLVRQRGGEPHQWIMEAPDAQGRFALLPASGDRADMAGYARRAA